MTAKPTGVHFFKHVLKSPRHIVAPMVDQSELGWRLLARAHGAHLCYTPMLHSGVFVRDANYRKQVFTTCPEDRPLIVQFCGNDPDTVLQAAKYVEDQCDAVDLNLGCPQNIARRGRYGAFLQDEWDTIAAIVKRLHEELSVPVTCKIRIFEDLDKTLAYAKLLEASGCQMLTVHGRTRSQKGPRSGIADWSVIKAIKQAVNIPVIANGNILYTSDIEACIRETGVDGVMSSETHLANPAVFSGKYPLLWDMIDEFMNLSIQHGSSVACCKAHLFRLLHKCVNDYPTLRTGLAAARDHDELLSICAQFTVELKARREKELAEGLWTLEEDTDDAAALKLASCHPDFEYPRIPVWRCQPRPRNHRSDLELLARETQSKVVEEEKDGHRISTMTTTTTTASASATTTTTISMSVEVQEGMSPAESKPKRPKTGFMSEADKAAQRKLQKELLERKANRFEKCELCNENPRGQKCDHNACRKCCKLHTLGHVLNCSGHRYRFQDKVAAMTPEEKENFLASIPADIRKPDGKLDSKHQPSHNEASTVAAS
eukprot:m.45700 g.45700  ORF g.45700 m.45700 type:complete len:545 (-) comp12197_c0_seq1:142-1776(-)